MTQKIPAGRYRLKATAWTRDHGHACHGPQGDTKVYPNEVGLVEECAGAGYYALCIAFDRGRRVEIGARWNAGDNWVLYDSTIANFERVRPGKRQRAAANGRAGV